MKAFCIYGPPGTGKTTEIVRLINETIVRNPGGRVAFLSHTRVAAREAINKGNCKMSADDAMTLHSLCFRMCGITRSQVVSAELLQRFGDEVGFPMSGNSPDSERDLTDGDMMLAIYDLSRARMVEPEEQYEISDRPATAVDYNYFIRSYEDWKHNLGYIDFTDMLSAALLTQKPPPYKAFFIDEAQDLSALQRSVLYHFVRDAALVFMAGDDDQAIFEWAGADPAGMPEFERRFDAQRKVLDQSHRIPRAVHALAENIISYVSSRVPKEYKPRAEMGEVNKIGSLVELELDGPSTWLYRDRSVRAEMELDLQARAVPYTTLVGFPAPLQTKPGRAMLALRGVLQHGNTPDMEELRRIDERLTDRGKKAYLAGKRVDNPDWPALVNMPFRIQNYLCSVDFDKPAVVLSSIHSFKGAEANHIVLSTGMSGRTAANLSEREDEEHRIFYVGVTRARDRLTIVEGDNAYPHL